MFSLLTVLFFCFILKEVEKTHSSLSFSLQQESFIEECKEWSGNFLVVPWFVTFPVPSLGSVAQRRFLGWGI